MVLIDNLNIKKATLKYRVAFLIEILKKEVLAIMENNNYEILSNSYVEDKLYYCVKIGSSVCIMPAVDYERIVLDEQKYMSRQGNEKRLSA